MHATAAICAPTNPGIIRRYCVCELGRGCLCDLASSRSGWTIEKLARLRQSMRDHGSLSIAAAEVDETVRRANVALEALLGRSPQQAFAALEAKVARERYEAEKASQGSGDMDAVRNWILAAGLKAAE